MIEAIHVLMQREGYISGNMAKRLGKGRTLRRLTLGLDSGSGLCYKKEEWRVQLRSDMVAQTR